MIHADILVITNYRSLFGTAFLGVLCLKNRGDNVSAILLKNNPYSLDAGECGLYGGATRVVNPSDIFLYFDDTEKLLIDNGIRYVSSPEVTLALFEGIKAELVVLADAPIIKNDVIGFLRDKNIPILNMHAAELPLFRGNWATYANLMGRRPLCMSFHLVNEKIDGGFLLDRYYQPAHSVNVERDTFFSIELKLWTDAFKYFADNYEAILEKAKRHLNEDDPSALKHPLVKVGLNDRNGLKREFDSFVSAAYSIERCEYNAEEGFVRNMTFNTGLSRDEVMRSMDAGIGFDHAVDYLNLKHEEIIARDDYGLVEADKSEVFTGFLIDKAVARRSHEYPGGKKWCVVLTHDVDMIPDDFEKVKDALKIEAEFGFSSTYLMAAFERPELQHRNDPKYLLKDNNVRNLIYYIIANNNEIGLHGSYGSFNNVETMLAEKNILEESISLEVKSIRQHYLNFENGVTFDIQEECGFVCDSSLGFPGELGVRTSSSFPYFPYSPIKRRNLRLLELPFLIMDQNVFWNPAVKERPLEEQLLFVKRHLDYVRSVGGVVVLDWHLHTIASGWWQIYREILECLHRDRSCFVSRMDQFYYFYQNAGKTMGEKK